LADDGRRKLILNGVVTQLQTATGASYFYDYSSGVVTLLNEPIEERVSSTHPVQIRVYDGNESTTVVDFNNAHSVLDVRLRVTVRAEQVALMTAVQNVLADISRVIGAGNELGGPSTVVQLDSVEAPSYEFSNRVAVIVVHLRAEYTFVPGTDT